jgi:hypothetical protein
MLVVLSPAKTLTVKGFLSTNPTFPVTNSGDRSMQLPEPLLQQPLGLSKMRMLLLLLSGGLVPVHYHPCSVFPPQSDR